MRSTNQSKVYNRPIAISDIAISKVPQTKLPGLRNDENSLIQELHKCLLIRARELCKMHRNLSIECAVVYNIVNKNYIIVDGVAGSVNCYINRDDRIFMKSATKNSLVYMHNHPSTGTFSAGDIRVFCKEWAIFIMTVVGNDGNVYVLAKTGMARCDDFIADYMKLSYMYSMKGERESAKLAVKDMLKEAYKYGIIYKKGRHKK